jgi:regulator of protease activity HflC (stomatin/prohibitin superfamily)
MIWLVLTIVLGIAAIAGRLFAPGGWRIVAPVLAAGAWVILTIALSLHTVAQREVGIVQSFSGTIGSNYKSSGIVMTAPWNHILKENIGLQKEVFDFSGTNSAVSKDQQPINATLVVNFQVEPRQVIQLYKTVGPSWKIVLLDGRIPQDFKETTAQFSSPDITLKRPALRKITLSRLRHELARYDIKVVDVFVNNVSYSAAYTAAIEKKLVQRQAAQQAEAKVAQATAEANQKIAAARGEAKSIELEGKALHNNPEVLRLRAINTLNPKAQVIFCNSGDCPSILGGSFTAAPANK